MWWKASALILFVIFVFVASALSYGRRRWRSGTEALRARLKPTGASDPTGKYNPGELKVLPVQVRSYFRTVLEEGQPIITRVRIRHQGQFNRDGKHWVPFTSNQLVVPPGPGFDWDARIRMAPGVDVFVHDAYVQGEGILHAALFGLATVAQLRGTREAAEGELMRFLAEAAWYPTALLPSQGARWEAVSEDAAQVTLTDGATTVSLRFQFNTEGLIHTVRTDARYRLVGGKLVPTPWQCRVWGYEWRHGVRIPLDAEVAWIMPDGPAPYWRGHIIDIAYETSPP